MAGYEAPAIRFASARPTSNALKRGTKYETEFDSNNINSLQEKNKSSSDRVDDGLVGDRFAIIYYSLRLDDISQIRDPGIVDVAGSLTQDAAVMTRVIVHYGIAAGTADMAIGSKITDITKMSRFYEVDRGKADVEFAGPESRRAHIARVEMVGTNYGKIVQFQQDSESVVVDSSKSAEESKPKEAHKNNPKQSVRSTTPTPLQPGAPLDPGPLIPHWSDLVRGVSGEGFYPDAESLLIADKAVQEYDAWPTGRTEKSRETWDTVLKYVTNASVISPNASLADKERWYTSNVLKSWAWSAVFIRWCASDAGFNIGALSRQGASHIGYFLSVTNQTFESMKSGTIPSDYWIYLRGPTEFTDKVKQGRDRLNSTVLPTYEEVGYRPQLGDVIAGVGGGISVDIDGDSA